MIPARVESEELLHNHLEENQSTGWQGSIASLAVGKEVAYVTRARCIRATQEHGARFFGTLILNFFQRSCKPHFS